MNSVTCMWWWWWQSSYTLSVFENCVYTSSSPRCLLRAGIYISGPFFFVKTVLAASTRQNVALSLFPYNRDPPVDFRLKILRIKTFCYICTIAVTVQPDKHACRPSSVIDTVFRFKYTVKIVGIIKQSRLQVIHCQDYTIFKVDITLCFRIINI